MKIILIGSGKLIHFLAKQFASKGYYLTIIDPDEQEATTLSRNLKATVILGKGDNLQVLKEAGAYEADVLLSLTPQDQDNLIACQIANKQYGVPRTIALVNDPENQPVFEKLGVSVAFSATQIITSIIEQQTNFEEIKNLIPVAEGKINITEITLPEDSSVVGKTLQELQLPEGTLIACILRQGNVIVPKGQSTLNSQDRLILISQPEQHSQLLRFLTGE
jgi:trk system potassium uptake protein